MTSITNQSQNLVRFTYKPAPNEWLLTCSGN